jgi:hypothetical protein
VTGFLAQVALDALAELLDEGNAAVDQSARRRSVNAARAMSTPAMIIKPTGPAAGAPAGVLGVHSPTCPGWLQVRLGPVQAASQHTRSTQNSDAHWPFVVHPPPFAIGVTVAVALAVCVAVPVAVAVFVWVGVAVAGGWQTPDGECSLQELPSPNQVPPAPEQKIGGTASSQLTLGI